MKFMIPFVYPSRDIEILKRRSKSFVKFTSPKPGNLSVYLKDAGVDITQRQYLSICYQYLIINFIILSVLIIILLLILQLKLSILYGLGISFMISIFILFNQINYPKLFSMNKARNVEKNLLAVLQDMLVQINSGVPLFEIMVNIASSRYGEVSETFKKIIKEINAGTPQIDAIEKYGRITNSKYFKRVLLQMSNGIRAGSEMSIIIKDGIRSLANEQTIQIQNYGGRLNPSIMFYMLIAVILPSLGITFMIIIASLLNLSKGLVQLIFFTIMGFVVFMQIMFLGVIKSRRPSLL